MLHIVVKSMLAVLIVAGLSACEYPDPTPEPTQSPKAGESLEDIKVNHIVSDKALCTKLDYLGSRDNPTTATLTCQDGDVVTIPGPFTKGMYVGEQVSLPDGGTKPGDDGVVYIESEQGKHAVWYYNVSDDGTLHVFYDEKLRMPTSGGDSSTSKVAVRNFSTDDTTTSIAWK